MDVTEAVDALRDALGQQLDATERGAAAAYDEATNAESKAENKYDTRSLEASYLARGQAERVQALRGLVGFFRGLQPRGGELDGVAGLGCLVGLEDDRGDASWWFLAPVGGGTAVDVGGATVRVVTPGAPLGDALQGAAVDDDLSLPNGREAVVVSVQG